MPKPPGGPGRLSVSRVVLQLCFTIFAFALWTLPVIQPIKVMAVLLHEMSHGLVALASGGTVHDILITPDEGGACRSDGGNPILIAGAGYLGSMFFGGMILRAARGGSSVPITYALLALLVLGAAVTVLHDPYSRTFGLALAGSFIFLGLAAPGFLGALFLRAIGTVSCLYAIFDIYSDLIVDHPPNPAVENDAQTFAALTGLPALGVAVAWLLVSVVFFVATLRASLRGSGGSGRAAPAGAPAAA